MRVACLGAGYFSQFHLAGWHRIGGVDLVGICDHDAGKAAATGLPVYTALPQMLAETRPDILDIIVPPAAHVDAIRTALEAGIQTIICQKPFCTSQAEARRIVAEAEAAGSTLIVHENFRFQPWYRALKTAIADGAIGTPLQARFHLRPGDGQGTEAYLARQPYFQKMDRFLIHETGVHWVDTFRFLFGDPIAVYADLRRVNPVISGEDAGIVLLDFDRDMRVIFDGNRCLDHAAQNTRCTMGEGLFEGTEGSLRLDGDGSVHLRKFGTMGWELIHPADESGTFGGDCTYHLQRHVAEALRGEGTFENLASDYLNVIKIEAAIYRSAKTGGKIYL